jgi:deazaflavin-dependent oxidoreductase (nitroreductase family)
MVISWAPTQLDGEDSESRLGCCGLDRHRLPDYVTLEVIGRKSGRIVSLPLVVVMVAGQRYLVSMLGEEAQWVRNVRAAGGRAVIRSGGREAVQLQEVPAKQRAPILKAYLQIATGARPHIPVNKDAPLAEFEQIAAAFPVFRLISNEVVQSKRTHMSEDASQDLKGVAETLLIPLYIRAIESQRPDALLKDERAVAFVTQMDSAFSRIKRIKMDEEDKVALVLRNREFDRYARDFLARYPEAVVVHIGCGLDARFERVDNGQVEWYDLDLPEVIELRRKFIGGERERYHFLACSAFDSAWLNPVSIQRQRPFLFLVEGVFMYFEEAQVKSLVLMLRDCFPGAELVFDAFSPFLVRANNLRLRISRTKIDARYHWGLKCGKDLENWGDGICLLEAWFPFDRPEPRLAHVQWVRYIPLLAKVMGIFHYQLGKTAA